MGKFKFTCYDEKNNIIVNNHFNNRFKILDSLNDIDENEYENIQYINDVPHFSAEEKFKKMNFIKKVCYFLNKLTKFYYLNELALHVSGPYKQIENLNKIIFTLDSNKFIINKIKSNKNYNIYNINYIENNKEIFNNNIFLYNFNYISYYPYGKPCDCGNIYDEKFDI